MPEIVLAEEHDQVYDDWVDRRAYERFGPSWRGAWVPRCGASSHERRLPPG